MEVTNISMTSGKVKLLIDRFLTDPWTRTAHNIETIKLEINETKVFTYEK